MREMFSKNAVVRPGWSRSLLLSSVSLSLGVFAISGPVKAQDSDEASTAEASDVITVTARRRAENLQEVPDTITVFTSETIENARIRKFDDFAALTPNMEFLPAQSPGNFSISIRGVSMASLGEAPVAMVVDGVTQPYPNSFNVPLFDIESIQVLKGPQGALYGQNAIGGAVVITTKQPTNEFEGRATLSYGAHDERGAIVTVSGPLVKDKLLLRMGYNYNHFDGDFRYAFSGDLQNFTREHTGRVDLKWIADDTLTADLGFTYSEIEFGGGTLVPESLSPFSAIPNVTTDQLNGLLVLGVPNQDLQSDTSREVLSGSGRLVWDLGFAELISVTAYTEIEENNFQDADVSIIPFVGGTQTQDVEAFAQEFRLSSPSDQRFRWLITGFIQRTDRIQAQNISANLNLILTGDIDPANEILVPASVLTRTQTLNSNAAAVQLNYDILPELELTFAGRYDHNPRAETTVFTAPPAPDLVLARTFNKFQPKASITYKPTATQTYYATFAEGFRAGGFNGSSTAVLQPVFDAEETRTYEVGAKFVLFDRRAFLNIAAYQTRYENQQLTLTSVDAGGALSQGVFTVDKSRIRGFEAELQTRPAPGLEINAAVGVQDTEIQEFGDSLSGAALDPSGFIGNQIPDQSKYTLALTGQYSAPITENIDGLIRVDFTRRGRLFWYSDNLFRRDPFNLVNVKASVLMGNMEIGFYGRNIFDVDYNTAFFDNRFVGAPGGFNFGFRGAKARYGGEVTVRF